LPLWLCMFIVASMPSAYIIGDLARKLSARHRRNFVEAIKCKRCYFDEILARSRNCAAGGVGVGEKQL